MRITITFDSATTVQARALSVALNRTLDDNNLTLGVEGPEAWHGETPHLTPLEFAAMVGQLGDGLVKAEPLKVYPTGPAPKGHNDDHDLDRCHCNMCKTARHHARVAESNA